MDKEILEVVLQKSANDSKIKRIIDIKWESALPKGENYTSTIFRVSLKVVLGNGRISKKCFIAKKENSWDGADNIMKNYSLSRAEATIYITILREMDYLMEEFGDTEGPLWCKLIYFNQADSTIILEDLKDSGFITVKRTEMQDLEHGRLALRNIGRYHAMAKVLEERGLISKDNYKSYALIYDQFFMRNIIYGGIRALVKGMRATWGKEWAETADKLSQISFEDLSKKIQNNADFDDNTFKCLNHGDCWNNNMMFKHNWEGKPIEFRLIDFQGPHYSTPCVDIIYFMYTSIKPEVRRKNYRNLIQLYHESLISSLDKFGYKGSKPSLEEIENALERLSIFALALFTGSFPVSISKSTDAMDINKVFENKGEEGFNLSIYSEEGVIDKLEEDIKAFLKLLD